MSKGKEKKQKKAGKIRNKLLIYIMPVVVCFSRIVLKNISVICTCHFAVYFAESFFKHTPM